MAEINDPCRYSVIKEKNKREIVMLRGQGCVWRRCRFCDYHTDSSKDEAANFNLNAKTLSHVNGIYGKLEVINSGSFIDLDEKTLKLIQETCIQSNISQLHFECHWMHRDAIPRLKADYAKKGITVKIKTGVETFDSLFRESYLDKGISTDNPAEIAKWFDEACLLFGLPGQTAESMENDIQTGLRYFERICVNIMQKNSRPILPDPTVIQQFQTQLYPKYKTDPRIDILLNNTDFGVGGEQIYDK